MSDTISVQVTNTLGFPLNVYITTAPSPPTPPSTDPAAYAQTYTLIGTVPANETVVLDTGTLLARLVITQEIGDFPVKLFVTSILGAPVQPVTIAQADLNNTAASFQFYQDYIAQPYSPVSLQFNEIVLAPQNVDTMDTLVSTLLVNSGYSGADYFGFSMVSFWANNSLFAWPNTYYCYTTSPLDAQGFIAPPVAAGTLIISTGTASFTATDGGNSYPTLTYTNGKLSSPGANATTGLLVIGIYRTMVWEGQPAQSGMFWVGTRDGKQFILQPYQDTSLPWWIAAYNLAFASFLGVQVVMMVDMAKHVLSGVANGAKWLSDNAQALYSKMRGNAEGGSESADPDASAGDDIDPINVDVDVDVDVDIDTDVITDTDNVTDTDTDVDIDIDIDIDDDVFAVIDVDVDVDVDIDTDVVTDTDNVTDTDVDVDVDIDIDTDVEVPPGGVKSLLSKVGNWIMKKGFPALVKNIVIAGAMMGTQKLLEVWRSTDSQDLDAMSPQESTGLGLLLNYMLNDSVSEAERWTTFSDWVQQEQPDITTQKMLLTSILMFKNPTADNEQASWRWPQATQTALEQQMAQFSASPQQYQAYQALAAFNYQNQPLPVKVGASTAIAFLGEIA